MNAEKALNRLLEGNKRYVSGKLAEKDVGSAREATKAGQKPFVTILTCADSRVVPEFIFDANIGELFVIRNAGNVVDAIVLGTIEYGVEHLGTPLLVVMGHEKCGAVTAACSGENCPPNIAAIMSRIKPAKAKGGEVEQVITHNIDNVVEDIRNGSEIIRHLEKQGKLKIARAKYFFEDGRAEIK